MEYGVLGDLCARTPTEDLTPRGRRSIDLLAVLLLRPGQPVAPEVLLDLVWEDAAPGLDISVVHTQVARVRRALGPDALETTPSGYRLSAPATDAARFTELVARARSTLEPAAAIESLREALALWRGDRAFADVSDGLADAEASRLNDARQGARERLAELLLRTDQEGADEQALELARSVLAEEPLRERSHEIVMRACCRLGRPAEALLTFDELRVALSEELGVDPGTSIRELHARVLDDDPGLRATGPAPAQARPVARAPAPTSGLIGREDDLRAVLDLARTRRLVTIVGPGGVGKTRLLIELEAELAELGDTAYVDLAQRPDDVVEAMATALALSPGAGDPVVALAEAVADRAVVLLIDEAEGTLEETATLVAGLGARCQGLRFVVTSRRPLGVVGESVHQLEALGCPASDAGTEEILGAPAVRLLSARLADHRPALEPTSEEWRSLARLARRVDGLPLALELVAAHAAARSLTDIDDLLGAPLDLPATEVGRPDRHQSLRDTIHWTASRLPDSQRATLRRLGVFAGPFDLAAARAVVGPDGGAAAEIDRHVHALVRESMLHAERAGGVLRFRMLRTVSDLAIESLTERGELEGARARHRQWHAARWRGDLGDDALLPDVRAHYGDYIAALRSSLEAGDGRSAAELSLALGRLWSFTGYLGPALRWFERVLSSALLTPHEDARVRTVRASVLLYHRPIEARNDLVRALEVFEAEQDEAWLSATSATLAMECSAGGEHEEAVAHARTAVRSSRESADNRLAERLGVLAAVAAEHDSALAEAAAAEAWTIARASSWSHGISGIAANVAWTLFALGLPDDGSRVLAEARRRLDPGTIPTFFRLHEAWAALLRNDHDSALAEFARAIDASPDALTDRKSADIYLGAACAMAATGHPDAAELLAGAEALTASTGYVPGRWQEALVAEARAKLAGLDVPWGADQIVVGTRLADLVRAGAGP